MTMIINLKKTVMLITYRHIDDYVTGITDSVSSRSSGALNQCGVDRNDSSENFQKSKMVPKPVVLVVDGHLFSRLMGVEISL